MAPRPKRFIARRLLFVLTALVAAAWILSFVAPRQIAYRSTPQPAPENDLAPSDKSFVVRAVSERGQVMVMRGWEYLVVRTKTPRFSLSRPEFSAQTLPATPLNRLGFESFTDNSGTRGNIGPYWLLFVVVAASYAATFIRERRGPRGFAVGLPRAAEGEK